MDEIVATSPANSNADYLRKKFAQRGWDVSQANSSHDVCPDCRARAKLAKSHLKLVKKEEPLPQPAEMKTAMGAAIATAVLSEFQQVVQHPQRAEIDAALHAGQLQSEICKAYGVSQTALSRYKLKHLRLPTKRPSITALIKEPVVSQPNRKTNLVLEEAPREPTREEKRIILSKLQEVYLDDGYDNGWSDRRVAEDLGVAQKWVADLREPNFGPDNSNDESRQFVAEIQRLSDDLQTAQAVWDEDHKAIAKTVDNHNKQGNQLLDLRRQIETLEKQAKRIERQFR